MNLPNKPKKDFKGRQIAKIHIAKKQLGLDDETYREALMAHGNATSSNELTPLGIAKVLRHFESCGFKEINNDQ